MEELFGWAEGTVVGRDLYEVLGLDQGSGLRRDLPRALLNHGRWEGEVEGLHRDGDLRAGAALGVLPPRHRGRAGRHPGRRPRPGRRSIDSVVRVDDEECHSEPGLPGLFVLHYQPEVNLEHLSVVSCEALLRWHHPGLGLLSPGGFLGEPDLAARLEALGAWTFFAACRQAALWTADHDLRVTVNISGQQLADRELAGRVRLAMTAAGVETGTLRRGGDRRSARVGSGHHPPGPRRAGRDRCAGAARRRAQRTGRRRAGPTCRSSGIKLGRSLIDGVAATPDRRDGGRDDDRHRPRPRALGDRRRASRPRPISTASASSAATAPSGSCSTRPAPPARSTSHLDHPLAVRWDRVEARRRCNQLLNNPYGPVTWALCGP